MWQELIDPACGLNRQAFEYVLEIAIRIVSVELRGVGQAHDVSCTLASTQRAGNSRRAHNHNQNLSCTNTFIRFAR
jgi:hypothetical protein